MQRVLTRTVSIEEAEQEFNQIFQYETRDNFTIKANIIQCYKIQYVNDFVLMFEEGNCITYEMFQKLDYHGYDIMNLYVSDVTRQLMLVVRKNREW